MGLLNGVVAVDQEHYRSLNLQLPQYALHLYHLLPHEYDRKL